MQPERWARINEVVNQCLDLPSERREAHLAAVCDGDLSLMAEVNSLLASFAEVGDFMASSVFEADAEEPLVGRQIGNYQIRECIGEGGMATVYRAVRASDFEKQVAIKIVKRGMDTNFILQRFRYERQILAGLDHPNIARLLDGGATPDGRPYLVMELIEGTPITDYAEHRSLTVRQRLRLFQIVCEAVQYAHQNLVVHRDLKPGNILVTEEGIPKLLDFGIAKLLEPGVDRTIGPLLLMTPECASPEQVRGEPITTASDLYSLGVLLYHLLAGAPPYEFTTRTVEEIRRVVCETEPKKPGAVRPVPGDLDNIVLKAMHKDPSLRYASAEQLSQDVERHMAGLPVLAREGTFRYRAGKFVGRHKTATVAAVVVAVTLLSGVGVTLWEAHIARQERARAERRFNDVRELANSLIFELHDGIKDLPGSTPVRKLLVERALRYLDRLSRESSGDRGLQREIAGAYERIGDVQGTFAHANLGDSAGALRSFQKEAHIRQQLGDADPKNRDDQLALAGAYRRVATQLMANGSPTGALNAIQKGIRISEQLLPANARDVPILNELGWAYQIAGHIESGENTVSLRDTAGALRSYRKAIALREEVLKIDPRNEAANRSVVINSLYLGDVLFMAGDLDNSLASYKHSLELERMLQAHSSGRVRDLAVTYNRVAGWYERTGDFQRAFESYRETHRIYTTLAAADPRNALAQVDLATANVNVGSTLSRIGGRAAAFALMDRGILMGEALAASDPANFVQRTRLAFYYIERGEARGRAGLATAGFNDLKKALSILQKQVTEDTSNSSARLDLAACHAATGRLAATAGLAEQAAGSFHTSLDIASRYTVANPADLQALYTVADAYSGLGDIKVMQASSASPLAERLRLLEEARSFFVASQTAWRRIVHPLALSPDGFDAGNPVLVAERLVRCDSDLATLHR